jgi:hypothetical protein
MADHRTRQPWCSSTKLCLAAGIAGVALFVLVNRTLMVDSKPDVALSTRLGAPKHAAVENNEDVDRVPAEHPSDEDLVEDTDESGSESSTTDEAEAVEEQNRPGASNVPSADTEDSDNSNETTVETTPTYTNTPLPSSPSASRAPRVHNRTGGPFTFPPLIEFGTCEGAVSAQDELIERTFDGINVVTNIRDDHLAGDTLAGVPALVLLFHGCSNSKESWQLGVPERMFVHDLFMSNSLVIAFSAKSTAVPDTRNCWESSPPAVNADLRAVLQVLRHLSDSNPNFGFIPLVGMGVSSGGMFVSMLATILYLQSIAVYIAPLNHIFSQNPSVRVQSSVEGMIADLPPQWLAQGTPGIMMVHMPVDEQRARLVHATIEEMSKMPEVVIREVECFPSEFSVHMLHTLMPTRISSVDSEVLYQQLSPVLNEEASGSPRIAITTNPVRIRQMLIQSIQNMLDRRGKDGVLHAFPNDCCNRNADNGRFSSNGLCSRSDELDTLDLAATEMNKRTEEAKERLVHVVMEVLKAAFAQHEMTADHSAEVVTFLLSTRASSPVQ